MTVHVEINAAAYAEQMQQVAKQFPFAASLAMNRSADYAMAAVKQGVRSVFIARVTNSPRWLANQVRIERQHRADKRKLSVTISINPMQGGKATKSSLLPLMEEGFLRSSPRPIGATSVFPQGTIAVPNRKGGTIPRSLYPSSLGLQARQGIEGGYQNVWIKGRGRGRKRKLGHMQTHGLKGNRRTFIVRTAAGRGLVLQRYGKGKQSVRTLFLLRPPAHVRARAFFYANAQQEYAARIENEVQVALAQAMATAR